MTAPAGAEIRPRPRTPFDQGNVWLSIGGGTQTAFGERYVALGAHVGYFVVDGLELGAGAAHLFGGPPSIDRVSPSVRYVAQPLVGHSPLIPYVGAFYNHWFIGDDIPDDDTIGARAGLLHVSGRFVFGLGVVVEHEVSECFRDCTQVYPDVTLGLSL